MKYNFNTLVQAVDDLKAKVQIKVTKKEMQELMRMSRDNPAMQRVLVEILAKRTDFNLAYQDNFTPVVEQKPAYTDYRKELVKKQTKAEKLFKALLKSLDIKYKFQHVFRGEGQMRIVDFYLPDYNYVIEIDGGYHSSDMQQQKDKDRTAYLKHLGVKRVIRFTNKEVYDSKGCIERIKKELKL